MSERLGIVPRILDRFTRRRETPVVLCIDVEPDTRVFDPSDPPPWVGFERFVERLPALRDELSEATGRLAAFTWFLRIDPQVAEGWGSATWGAEKYADVLSELTASGDELALHTHLWRWDSQAADWLADYEDPVWADHCVTMGLDGFEEAFGRECAVHRGGDHYLSGPLLSLLEARGVQVDLTVEPGLPPSGADAFLSETARGPLPDYRHVPAQPYRSSSDLFPAPDPTTRSDPLLIPLFSARRRRPPFSRLPLYLWEPSTTFGQRLAGELLPKAPPVVAAAVRSDAPLSPYIWDMITERLRHLAQYRQMVFVTATEAADHCEGSATEMGRGESVTPVR